jgi:hypothetical protein
MIINRKYPAIGGGPAAQNADRAAICTGKTHEKYTKKRKENQFQALLSGGNVTFLSDLR